MKRSLALALATFLLLPAAAGAQARLTGADIAGTVADQSGGVLPGALVTVTNVATNVARTATAGEGGRFYVAALPPGTYRVSASLQGFATQTTENVVLELGQLRELTFSLPVGGVTAAVNVTAPQPLVEAARTEVSSVINQEQIEALPINGRNFISFSVITPGVTNDRTPQQGASATSGLSFGGQRARSNNIMVDGFDNNDQVVGAVRATFSQEAVREFQVLTNSYSAEFGKASGGVVNIVTKSGTNQLAGNAFFYFRDDRLNARSHFEDVDIFGNAVDLDKAPFDQKQWGGTAGGPIVRDRTFFFGSFEQTNINATNLVTIQREAADLLNGLGFPVATGNVPYAIERTEFMAKVDHHWTPGHSLVIRGSFADIENENIEPFGGTVARSRGAVQLRRDWSLAASQTDILSNTLVNEFRVQVAPQNQDILSLDPRCGDGPCVGEGDGGPTLEIAGVVSVGRQRFTPNPRENRRLQIGDTVSYLVGDHNVKAGVEFNQIWTQRGSLALHFGGRYIFSAIPALGIPSALEALRRGLPAAYVQGYGNSAYPYDSSDVSLFVQDEWRLGRMVLKPGLRYQRQFWPDFQYDIPDLGGTRFRYAFPDDGDNIAPRLAAAYDLTADGRTPIHASYGLYYDNTLTSMAGITQILDGDAHVRTLVVTLGQSCGGIPCSVLAWNSPGRRLPEATAAALLGGSYPTLEFAIDPALETPYSHQASAGFERALGNNMSLAMDFVYVRGFNQVGTIDYNPVVTSLGTSRRPNDLPCSVNPAAPCIGGAIPGSSASVLQYTSFGETWYRGLTSSLRGRIAGGQFLVSYTLSKAEDNSTDFQSNFIPERNGAGRNPSDRFGLPVGFDPNSERGPATHDQRHRFVLSGTYRLPWQLGLSAILTAASGRPFTPLAGLDLNGDGNGGAFPPDRARVNPADPATSVGRNSETTDAIVNLDVRASKAFPLGGRTSLELILDVFNVFNRANFIEDTNQSSFAIFGTGAFPTAPLPTYGKYTLTEPPRQMQVAAKISF